MKWSIEKANDWQQHTGWLLGFNYVPSSAVNSTEMWQIETYDRETIKRELALGMQTGFNACRVFLQYLVWDSEGDRFMETFSDFCNIAKSTGLSVMPVLFDDCAFSGKEPYLGAQDPPRPGVHNSGWTSSPGPSIVNDPAKEQNLCEYVKSVVSAFKDNRQIVVWDIYNEPCNGNLKTNSLSLVDKAFKWARDVSPIQPLTVAVWNPEDYTAALLELSDIITFHDYMPLDKSEALIHKLKEYKRPIMCTEWLNRPGGNTFETHLPLYGREIAGAFNWGMVLGKTQTNLEGSTVHGEPNANPKVWFHDLYYTDGRPYKEDEIAFIRRFSMEKFA